MNISNLTFNPVKTPVSYETPKNCTEIYQEVCQTYGATMPIMFLAVAFIIDIIEPFLYKYFLNDKIIWKNRHFDVKYNDFIFLLRVTKKIMIILAIVFIFMQNSLIS